MFIVLRVLNIYRSVLCSIIHGLGLFICKANDFRFNMAVYLYDSGRILRALRRKNGLSEIMENTDVS